MMKSHLTSRVRRRIWMIVAWIGVIALVGGTSAAAGVVDTGNVFHTVSPTRVLDTRSGVGAPKAPIGPNQVLNVIVADIPDATAIVVNVTAINGTTSSYLNIYANKDVRPNTSTLNWQNRGPVANGATVAIHPDHIISLYNATGSVDVIVDLVGYYTTGTPGPAGPTGPAGPAGDMGAIGPDGPAGAVGADGQDGKPGAKGDTGALGSAGPAGKDGASGPEGPMGTEGPAGPEGPMGPAGAGAGPAGFVYLQAVNLGAQTINRAPTAGHVLTFERAGTEAGDILFTPATGNFQVQSAGVYKVSFSIMASGDNQFGIMVNGEVPDVGLLTFGAAAGQPNVGTGIVTLKALDVVTLENVGSAGTGDVDGAVPLAVGVGGKGVVINAWIIIEQLNQPG